MGFWTVEHPVLAARQQTELQLVHLIIMNRSHVTIPTPAQAVSRLLCACSGGPLALLQKERNNGGVDMLHGNILRMLTVTTQIRRIPTCNTAELPPLHNHLACDFRTDTAKTPS